MGHTNATCQTPRLEEGEEELEGGRVGEEGNKKNNKINDDGNISNPHSSVCDRCRTHQIPFCTHYTRLAET